jgi:hypothetical protein
MMDITRNQYFFAGLVLLLVGIQFRVVDSFDLTAELTSMLAKQSNQPVASVSTAAQSLIQPDKPILRKNVRPPDWVGWLLLSAGAVLILHSWAMKKPGV